MKWNILHESRGRIRLHLRKPRMSLAEADQLQDYLTNLPGVRTAAVYERTCDVVIVYTESRAGIVRGLAAFRFDTEALAEVPANSPRAVNREYQEKLVNMTIFHFARKLFLPAPLRMVYTLVRSVPYIFRGLRCVFRRRLEVEVLDALSIGVSMLRGDFGTAGSVMFLLRLGELLEEWTQEIAGRPGPLHVAERGPRLAADRRGRGPCADLAGVRGRRHRRTHRQRYPAGRQGAGR